MAASDIQNTTHDLEAAGADPKLAKAIARAIRATSPAASQPPTWPIPVIAAVLIAAIGIVGAGVYKNGDRIDANRDRIDTVNERIDAVETRLAGDIADLSERMARIETLLDERLPPRR